MAQPCNTQQSTSKSGRVLWLCHCLLLSLGWLSVKGQAPALAFQRLSLMQGLPANYTMAIAQDKPGFIWIANVKGLTRFDGIRCLNFSRQIGDPRSLSHRIVRTVFSSRNGTLWVGAQEGLNRYDPATQTFQRYSFADLGPGSNFIRNIIESRDGRLWLGTKGGLICFEPGTGKITTVDLPIGDASETAVKSIRRTLIDGQILWIGTESGLFAYNMGTKQIRSFRHDPAIPTSLPGDYISALTKDTRTGDILLGTRDGHLLRMQPKTGQFQPISALSVNQPIAAILTTRTGDLWVGVNRSGLYHFDKTTNTFLRYVNNQNNPRSLISNSITNLFEDRSGVVWVLSDDAGVCWFNPTVDKLHSLYDEIDYQPVNTQGYDASGLSIDKTDNSVWAATRDGALHINPQTKTYQVFHHDPNNPNSLTDNMTYAVEADLPRRVWVGTNSGVSWLDPTTGVVQRIPSLLPPADSGKIPDAMTYKGIAGNQGFELLKAPDGRMFIGTNEKLTIYDPKTGRFLNQFNDPRIAKLPGKNYNTLYFDSKQNLWVGGLGPIYKISPDLRLIAQYVHSDDPHSLPDEGATGFAEDRYGRMWVCTDNGLGCLNQKTGKFQVFMTQHGLPHDDLSAVIIIGDTLWISSSRGLAYTDVRRPKFTVFNEADGFSSSEFESGSVVRDGAGRLYFGGMKSLIYAYPHRIQKNRFVPPVYLTSFRVNSLELMGEPSATPPKLELSYTQNTFTFEMAALNFDNPNDNQYAYRLENFDADWKRDGNRPFASYTNIPPGDYVLHVIAANNDGLWNREGYRLPITILAPFWQTWWFRITTLALLLGLTGFIARRRVQILAKEEREKSELRERIAASEMKALRSQMNPHFLYNSLNAIRLFILQNDGDNADKYLVKFARLMRLILDNSRMEWVTLDSELEQLILYMELEQLRFDDLFDFSINSDPTLSLDKTAIPPMIIQPYIENAILHGMAHKQTKGCIKICIVPKQTHLEFIIDDDGVGRERAQSFKKTGSKHNSVGLRVTEDRLQLIGQRSGQTAGVQIIDKYDDQQQATGTRVIIQMPFMSS
ncbi:histidine kinase [Spirosoma sp. BT702]|uniref:Histidine kinase n=1 Tax=Spirosoma profusum TaxID=2771354 RepID=A0A927ARV5_9BACT|nr:sensor histidine kinase [Spirosoma profusum]MBD2702881.1 histidine kinase [Spirosoma profusum]